MRLVVMGMCALVAAGVFAAMFVSIWSTRHTEDGNPPTLRQTVAMELVWAAIPCLMILAAAVPAVIAILSGHTGD
jgi:heme/copper-type cytochrome/quinol oxidase subunit 2